MWTYSIVSGEAAENGKKAGNGYSGHAEGRDNPAMCAVPNVGPIPPGQYRIGPAYADPHLGPCVMHLDPLPGTDTHGRTLFRIHGNDAANDASEGCVILGPLIREAISKSHDNTLEVTV